MTHSSPVKLVSLKTKELTAGQIRYSIHARLWCLQIWSKWTDELRYCGQDLIEGLTRIRLVLDSMNIAILCNGARRDAAVSSMARNMGGGRKVYLTTLGVPAYSTDLVPTLGHADLEKVSSVTDQMAFHSLWKASLLGSIPVKNDRDAITQAELAPDSWVYKLDKTYGIGPDQAEVPVEAIVGWWKVDPKGSLDAPFWENPEYIAKLP